MDIDGLMRHESYQGQFGDRKSIVVVEAVTRAIQQMMAWNGPPVASVDVKTVENQAEEALKI